MPASEKFSFLMLFALRRPPPWLMLCGLLLCTRVFADAVDYSAQRITLSLATEPPTLNHLIATDQISGFVLGHIMEGLTRYGPGGELEGGVAERWEMREDGATFWLREDARWSDGKPVRARDFVFAWQRALDPATGSQYAFVLYPIVNAEAINRGEKPVESLGVKAVGERRLEISFARPCPYFPGLTAFMTYFPVREDFYRERGERYAADAGDLLFNGPFMLDKWVHGAHLRLRRNSHYWNRDAVALSEIDMPYITSDPNAIYNLYKAGSIALAGLDSETLPDALERGFAVKPFQTGAVFFIEYNFRPGRVTANRSLRKAMQAIFDPSTLVNKIIAVPGYLPAYSLFPRTVKGVEGLLRDEYPAPEPQRGVALARRHLEQAKRELGMQQLPLLVLLAGDSPRAAREAEYFQNLFARGLGLEVVIDNQIFKQRIDKMRRGEFDMVMAGWGPDFDDAITYGDLFSSWNENNRGRYRNPVYDQWVRVALESADQRERMAAMAELQRIVMEDVPILPTYESGLVYVLHPALRGVRRGRFGPDPDFSRARLVEPEAVAGE